MQMFLIKRTLCRVWFAKDSALEFSNALECSYLKVKCMKTIKYKCDVLGFWESFCEVRQLKWKYFN